MNNNVFLRFLLTFFLGVALGIAIGKYLCESNYWGTHQTLFCDGPTPTYKADFNRNTIEIDPFAGGNPINASSASYEVEQPNGTLLTGVVNLGDPPPVLNFRWDNNFYDTNLKYYDSNQELIACYDNEHGNHMILSDVVIINTPGSPVLLDSLCGSKSQKVCSESSGDFEISVGSSAILTIDGVRTIVYAVASDTLAVLGTCKPENQARITIEYDESQIKVGDNQSSTFAVFQPVEQGASDPISFTIECDDTPCNARICKITN